MAIEDKYFEDFKIGEIMHSGYRTVTEADIDDFARISGDHNPLHTDKEFASKTIHGSRIAHGALTYAITTGLHNSIGYADGTTIAFLGLSMDFRKAVKPEDTLHLDIIPIEKRETKKAGSRYCYFLSKYD